MKLHYNYKLLHNALANKLLNGKAQNRKPEGGVANAIFAVRPCKHNQQVLVVTVDVHQVGAIP